MNSGPAFPVSSQFTGVWEVDISRARTHASYNFRHAESQYPVLGTKTQNSEWARAFTVEIPWWASCSSFNISCLTSPGRTAQWHQYVSPWLIMSSSLRTKYRHNSSCDLLKRRGLPCFIQTSTRHMSHNSSRTDSGPSLMFHGEHTVPVHFPCFFCSVGHPTFLELEVS